MDKIFKIEKNGRNSRWQLYIQGHPNIQGGNGLKYLKLKKK